MRYFLARELNFEYLCIVKKEFDNIHGKYYYEEIQGRAWVFILVQPIVMFSFLLINLVRDFKALI